jgi:hypothetical protein
MSTSKRYMDYVDENLIYDDDCASLPNYIMCARQSVLLATTAESAFFFVWSFLSALPCCCTQSSASSSACLCGAHSWVSFSVFTGGSRASCCERCVFFLFWKGVLRFGGDGGSEEGAERTEEGRLSIRFLTRPSARVLRLEAGRRWREPCCGLRCWRFCWFV